MIAAQAVTRCYGEKTAVDDVSFSVQAGDIVGFLGPNGAGKSTLLKMLATYIPPTSGRLTVSGHDVVRTPLLARSTVGYLAEHNALYEGMRVDRFLRFIGRAHGLRGAQLGSRLAQVAAGTQLEEVLGDRIEQCSKGFRQRIGLAAALIHDPPVLLLDEPTHGLDPLQVAAFRDFVRELARPTDGSPPRAILFSSHVLAEVAEISDRLLLLHRGKLLIDASLDSLVQAAGGREGLEGHILDHVREAAAPRDAAPAPEADAR